MKTIKTKNSITHNVVAKVRNIPKATAKGSIKTAGNQVRQGLKDSTEPQGRRELSCEANASGQMVDSGEDIAKRTVQGTYRVAKGTYRLVKKHRHAPAAQKLSDIASQESSAPQQPTADISSPPQADIKMRPQPEGFTQNAACAQPPAQSTLIKQRAAHSVKANTQAVKTKDAALRSASSEKANEISSALQPPKPPNTPASIKQRMEKSVKANTQAVKTKDAVLRGAPSEKANELSATLRPAKPSAPTAPIKQRAAQSVKANAQAVKTKEVALHSTSIEKTNEILSTLQPKKPHVTSTPIKQRTAQSVKTAMQTIKTRETVIQETAPCSGGHMPAPHSSPLRHSAPKATPHTSTHTPQKAAKASSAVKSGGIPKTAAILPDTHGTVNSKHGKPLQKRTIKTRSIAAPKGMQHTVKQDVRGIKTATQTAAKAKQSAKAAQKTAQQVARTAKAAAQKATQATKVVTKAVVSAIKAFLVAIKSLTAAIAALSGTALFIILMISLVAILAGSVLGIFMAAEPSGHGTPISEVTSQLNEEYYKKIGEIQANVKHDKLEIRASDGVMGIKWEDVLAIYSCKLAASDTPMEVVTFDEQKKEILRGILWDMNAVNHTTRVETKYIDVPVLDEDGNQIYNENGEPLIDKEPYTETTLIITVEHKTPDEMAAAYAFTPKQYKALALLKEAGYASLWAKLLGGLVNGGGEIITPDTDWTGSDIFAWPLPKTFSISSRYGYRKDPFTGKISFHGGTDIVAPYGTPILAAAGGTVTVANATDPWGMSYGYHVKINHGGGQETLYAHCSSICVTAGQTVQAGEVIGYVGSTGNSTGNHLHFEVRVNGQTVDAMGYFK